MPASGLLHLIVVLDPSACGSALHSLTRPLGLGTGVNATVRYLASSSPSLVPVVKKANFNVWGCFNNSSGLKIPRQLKYETLQYAEIERMSLLALLSTEFEAITEEPMSLALGHHCELPDNVKEKSIHFQYLVSTLARISSNLASQHDSSEGALTRKTSTALTESAEFPLYHKQVQKTKRRQRTTWSQRSREPKTMIIHSTTPQSLTPSGRGNDWRTV
ncbi:hypothetical protein VTO58DRAFT_110786 [Aureobasidium pullulans]